MGAAELVLTVSPRELSSDGSEATVAVSATTATGTIGVGTVRVTSSAGSLVDGVDLSLDAFGTARTPFTCNVATDAACSGRVTFTATWNADKETVTGSGSVSVSGPMQGSGGGAGGGGGGGGPDLSAIVCPPPASRRIWVYEEGEVAPVVNEPMASTGQTRCSTAKCEFVEATSTTNVGVLISIGSPVGTDFVADTTFSTGQVGQGDVYRLQYASSGRDCASQSNNRFRLENFTLGSAAITTMELRFACEPRAGNKRLTGCLSY